MTPPSKTLTEPRPLRRKAVPPRQHKPGEVTVRAVRRPDLDPVIAIDATVTGLEKRAYWQSIYRRYGIAARGERRWFLVAERDGQVVGFLIGEVRDWEFGSPPCGWVFALDVDPQVRQAGIASQLLAALSASLKRAGVRMLRTLLARDNVLILSFFRSQGMMAAPLIPLELDLLEPAAAAMQPQHAP